MILILINTILTVINLGALVFFRKDNLLGVGINDDGIKTFLFCSIIPILNIMNLIVAIPIIISALLDYLKEKEIELNKMNAFIQCNNCKVIIRKGYKENNICPICKEESEETIIKDDSIQSRKIPEHIKFNKKDLKRKQKEQGKNKSKSNEELYEQVKQNVLEKDKLES